MQVWRIVRAHRVDSAFDGEGARLYPGRWNHRGEHMVYASSSVALAAFEILVHLEDEDLLRSAYLAIPAEVPDKEVETLDPLPRDWADHPPGEGSRECGSQWLRSERSLALAVPSAVVPLETNYLLNPRHPEFGGVEIGDPVGFDFDPRLGSVG